MIVSYGRYREKESRQKKLVKICRLLKSEFLFEESDNLLLYKLRVSKKGDQLFEKRKMEGHRNKNRKQRQVYAHLSFRFRYSFLGTRRFNLNLLKNCDINTLWMNH